MTATGYDAFAIDYAKHRRVHPAVLEHLISGGCIREQSRVLEIGCGTGNYLAALRNLVGCECIGVDPSEKMLAHARTHASGALFELGRAENLPLASSHCDVAFAVDVIHHLEDCSAFVAEAHRVLVPGGRLCIVTDSEEIIRTRMPLSHYFPETVGVDLARYPSVEKLAALLQAERFACAQRHEVELSYATTDLGPYRDRAYSCLRAIDDGAFQRGMAQMERDVRAGPIPCSVRYVMVWATK